MSIILSYFSSTLTFLFSGIVYSQNSPSVLSVARASTNSPRLNRSSLASRLLATMCLSTPWLNIDMSLGERACWQLPFSSHSQDIRQAVEETSVRMGTPLWCRTVSMLTHPCLIPMKQRSRMAFETLLRMDQSYYWVRGKPRLARRWWQCCSVYEKQSYLRLTTRAWSSSSREYPRSRTMFLLAIFCLLSRSNCSSAFSCGVFSVTFSMIATLLPSSSPNLNYPQAQFSFKADYSPPIESPN